VPDAFCKLTSYRMPAAPKGAPASEDKATALGTVTPLRRPHASDHKIRRAPSGVLPVYVQFVDLVEANIVASHTGLAALIKHHGFPEGVWFSSMTRAWPLDEVTAWLRTRSAERPTSQAAKARQEEEDQASGAGTRPVKCEDAGVTP
jgi:hypothetical protein